MDLRSLSAEQLAQNLRELQQPGANASEASNRLQEAVHELQVHQVELEMQNRALRETQAELELSTQRYSDLFDHLPVGYITVTVEGQILQANLAASEILHRERAKLPGTFLRSYLDAYDSGRVAAHLESCAESGEHGTMDLTFRLKDGATAVVQFSSRVAPTGIGGDAPQIHIAITDISKLKQTQRMLEEINREQEAFNYSISHDLRAPLVTISNYAGIVLGDYAWSMSQDAKVMVERIRSAAARMEETLKNLLQYSTLAREEIVMQSVNADEVVKELLIEYRDVIQQRKADIRVEGPLPVVRACRPMLNQVLANLLTNALKYAKPDEPPRIHIYAEKREMHVVLKMADEGIGIDPKYHERVFRIFERLHGYSRYPGSGLGLAIARRAIERMNGRIWAECGPNGGSCFCIELPQG
jgi:PAS domain S-box-containing protein